MWKKCEEGRYCVCDDEVLSDASTKRVSSRSFRTQLVEAIGPVSMQNVLSLNGRRRVSTWIWRHVLIRANVCDFFNPSDSPRPVCLCLLLVLIRLARCSGMI